MKLSVIIPTLNAGERLEMLLTALENQFIPPEEIIVIDSSSTDMTREIAKKHAIVRLIVIPTNSFDHGGTRTMAANESVGDYLLFMTQDAIPMNNKLTEILIRALDSYPAAAAVYARQIASDNATSYEKLIRAFNYPENSNVQDMKHMGKGLRTFFLSNVCAAYRRETYYALGGFELNLRTNEDMLYAAKAIQHGYQIVYAAEAQVIHSHNMSFKEQYKRNKLQGYELARHKNLLGDDSPVGSGKEMLKYVTRGLLKQGRFISWIKFVIDCIARYTGNRAGKREYNKTRLGATTC